MAIRQSLILFLILTAFLLSAPLAASERSVKVIHIDYRRAEEVLPTVESLLSPQGSAAVDKRTNSLVVVDTEQSIQRISDFLKDFDQPVEQVAIRVRFSELQAERGGSVSTDGSVSGDDWEVSTGRKLDDGLSVQLEGRSSTRSGTSEYFINTASGSPAYIVAGTSVPYRQQWVLLSKKYAHVAETTEFQDVETGFEVTPVITGDRAHLDITPRISYLTPGGDRGVVRFTEAATSVTVPLNQWFSLSGATEGSSEVFREILGAGSSRQDSSLSISLMVTKQQ